MSELVNTYTDKLWQIILIFLAYQVIASIVSYKLLERDLWKANIAANFVAVLVYLYIETHESFGIFKIVFMSIVRAFTMVSIEQYIYKNDPDIKDHTFRTTILNVCAFCGELMAWLFIEDGYLKGLIIFMLFIAVVNAIGYFLLEKEFGLGTLFVADAILYVVGFLILYNKLTGGMSFFEIFKYSGSAGMGIKILAICMFGGLTTAICDKGAYNETEDMKSYLLIGILKSYCVNMTSLICIYLYMIYEALKKAESMTNSNYFRNMMYY